LNFSATILATVLFPAAAGPSIATDNFFFINPPKNYNHADYLVPFHFITTSGKIINKRDMYVQNHLCSFFDPYSHQKLSFY
jgi:hypothetical protein